jgi:hypothetical protein
MTSRAHSASDHALVSLSGITSVTALALSMYQNELSWATSCEINALPRVKRTLLCQLLKETSRVSNSTRLQDGFYPLE